MTIRVGPTEKNPTHHVKLTDRAGTSVGLILCDDKGQPFPSYNETPIEQTALKTATGGGTYTDMQYPYSPITQDDWSGGRGNLDIERDGTKFYDSYRMNTHRENKAFLGPLEHFTKGYKSMQYEFGRRYTQWYSDTAPTAGNMDTAIVADASRTMTRLWLPIRKLGTPAANLTVELRNSASDTVLATATITVASVTDSLSQWLAVSLSYALVSGTTYRIVLTQGAITDTNKWEWLYTKDTKAGTKYGCYIIETAAVDDSIIYFEYKGAQYKVLSITGSAPTIWLNGDRGTADANTGALTTLVDATKSWTVNQWVGCVVKIVQGTGKTESVQYRVVASNTSNTLTFTSAWTITHDTTTEYVIKSADAWQEITGHGLTVAVTSVLVVRDMVYFAQGDDVKIRSMRSYTNSGAWTTTFRAEGTATNKATYLAYLPIADKIYRAMNKDANGDVSISSSKSKAYGTDLSFSSIIKVGDKYSFINGIEPYPSDNGVEALWVFKEELPYIVTTTATGVRIKEMAAARSRNNGAASLVHGVYLYFSLGNGLERYYGGSIEDLGPNIGEGLPTDRKGQIVKLTGFPGRIFALIDGGTAGYSALMERSGGGWHEVYRAPLGQQIKGMSLQVIEGSTIDRIWLYVGNISLWLPYASGAVNELTDTAYTYTHEGSIVLSRMHAGLPDVQKLVKTIKLWSDGLTYSVDNSAARVFINIDYRLNGDTAWTSLATNVTTSPITAIDFSSVYGLAGKRIQLRLKLQSDDNTQTPILLAALVDAVIRIQVKYMYQLTFRCVDDEPTLAAREMDDKSVTAAGQSAITKLNQIKDWADASSDSLLYMTSNSPLYDGIYIFLNPPNTRQIAMDPDSTRQWTGNAFVCSCTAQEA